MDKPKDLKKRFIVGMTASVLAFNMIAPAMFDGDIPIFNDIAITASAAGSNKADSTWTKYSTPSGYDAIKCSSVKLGTTANEFKTLKSNGVDYVIMRVGYTEGSSNKIESGFKTTYNNAKNAGMKIGVYYYSLASTTNEARNEATFLGDYLKKEDISLDLPVFCYYIDPNPNSAATGSSIINEFCTKIRSYGYMSGLATYSYKLIPSVSTDCSVPNGKHTEMRRDSTITWKDVPKGYKNVKKEDDTVESTSADGSLEYELDSAGNPIYEDKDGNKLFKDPEDGKYKRSNGTVGEIAYDYVGVITYYGEEKEVEVWGPDYDKWKGYPIEGRGAIAIDSLSNNICVWQVADPNPGTRHLDLTDDSSPLVSSKSAATAKAITNPGSNGSKSLGRNEDTPYVPVIHQSTNTNDSRGSYGNNTVYLKKVKAIDSVTVGSIATISGKSTRKISWTKGSSGNDPTGYKLTITYSKDNTTKTITTGTVTSYTLDVTDSDASKIVVTPIYNTYGFENTGDSKEWNNSSSSADDKAGDVKIINYTSRNSKDFTITWGAVSGAKRYIVQKSTDGKSWTNVGETSSTSIEIKNLANGTEYQIAVIATSTESGTPSSAKLQAARANPAIIKPITASGFTATKNDSNISWTEAKNGTSVATSYKVYKYNESSASWESYRTLTAVTKELKSLAPGKYVIEAIGTYSKTINITVDGKTESKEITGKWSMLSNEISITGESKPTDSEIATVRNLTYTTRNNKDFTFTWSAVDKATKYFVYKSTDGKSWSSAGTIDDKTSSVKSIELKNLTNGTECQIAVVATSGDQPTDEQKKLAYNNRVVVKPISATGFTATKTVTDKGTDISWAEVKNGTNAATSYRIYKYDDVAEVWKAYRTVSASIKDINYLTKGKYIVEALGTYLKTIDVTVGDKTEQKTITCKWSALSNEVSVDDVSSSTDDKVGVVKNITYSTRNNKDFTFTWFSVNNATMYYVYKSTNGGSSWEEVEIVKDSSSGSKSVELKNLSDNTEYQIAIVATSGAKPSSDEKNTAYDNRVIVKPVARNGFTVAKGGSDISWTVANNGTAATTYKVYKYNEDKATWEVYRTSAASVRSIKYLAKGKYVVEAIGTYSKNISVASGDSTKNKAVTAKWSMLSNEVEVDGSSSSVGKNDEVGVVTNLSYKTRNNKDFTFTWSAVNNATKYFIYKSTDGNSWSLAGTIEDDKLITKSIELKSLTKGTEYHIAVVATSGSNPSTEARNKAYSNRVVVKPIATSGLAVTKNGSDISWTDGTNGSDTATEYKIYKYNDNKAVWEQYRTVSASVKNAKSLTPGKYIIEAIGTYSKRIDITDADSKISSKAINCKWSMLSDEIEIGSISNKSDEVGVVKNITYTTRNNKDFTVTWYSANNATKYFVYKSTDGKSWKLETTIDDSKVDTKSLDLKNLADGTEYHIAVVATSGKDPTKEQLDTAYNNRIVIKPVARNEFVLTKTDSNISWTVPKNSTSAVTNYKVYKYNDNKAVWEVYRTTTSSIKNVSYLTSGKYVVEAIGAYSKTIDVADGGDTKYKTITAKWSMLSNEIEIDNSSLATTNMTLSYQTRSGNDFTFNYGAVSGATKYIVQQKKADGKWTDVKTINADEKNTGVKSVTLNLDPGSSSTTYQLAIVATKDGDINFDSKLEYAHNHPTVVLSKKTNNDFKFIDESNSKKSWDVVKNGTSAATNYRVYKYNDATSKWESCDYMTSARKYLYAGTGKYIVEAIGDYTETVGGNTVSGKWSVLSDPISVNTSSTKDPADDNIGNVMGLAYKARNNNDFTISWSNTYGAKQYVVKKSTDGKNWTKLTTVDAPATSVEIKNLGSGKCYFAVIAKAGDYESDKKWEYAYDHCISVTPKASAKDFIVSMDDNLSSKINWTAVAGATKYKVYKHNDTTSKWDVYNTLLSSMKYAYCTSGKYVVEAIGSDSNNSTWTMLSNEITVDTSVKKGESTAEDKKDDGVGNILGFTYKTRNGDDFTLSWINNTKAKQYVIKQSTDGKNWTDAITVDAPATSVEIKDLVSGEDSTKYYFAIIGKADEYESDKKWEYAESHPLIIVSKANKGDKADEKAFEFTSEGTANKLSWSAVTGATYYRLYSYDTANSKWKEYRYMASTARSISYLPAGKYIVEAIGNEDGGKWTLLSDEVII